MSNATGIDFKNVPTSKIFHNMTSADTLSVSRLGDTVTVAKLWSAFVLGLPSNRDEQEVCGKLSTLFPTILYAHRNFLFELTGAGPVSGIPLMTLTLNSKPI